MKIYPIGSIFETMTTKKSTNPAPKSQSSKKSGLKNIGKPLKYTPPNRTQKYIQGISEGNSKKQAALDAGYAKSVAANAKSLIEGTKLYQTEIERLKGCLGGSDYYLDVIAKRLIELLMKNETVLYRDNEDVMREFTGSQPAPSAVGRAVDLIAKLTGFYAPSQIALLDRNEDVSNLSNIELKQAIAENNRKLAEKAN